MLNYIWAALIVSSLLFAGGYDISDIARDTYRNGQALPVELELLEPYDPADRFVALAIHIDPQSYARFYGTPEPTQRSYAGSLVQTAEGRQLRFDAGSSLPEPLTTIGSVSRSNDGELQGTLVEFGPSRRRRPAPGRRLGRVRAGPLRQDERDCRSGGSTSRRRLRRSRSD